MTQELKIITWNVWFDPKFQAERIQGIIAEIQSYQPDVACLQEITTPILQFILASVDVHRYAVWYDEFSTKPYGQIFIIKKNANVTAFGSSPFPDTKMHRRIFYITLKGQTTILNVHLESEFSGHPNSAKARQLAYLLEFARVNFSRHRTIIAGDFNLTPQDENWSQKIIQASIFTDISPLNHHFTYDYLFNTNIIREYRSHLDRVLCNVPVQRQFRLLGQKPIELAQSPGRIYPSDHFGILMHL